MKFNKWFVGLATSAAVMLACSARAVIGFDAFANTRTAVLVAPTNFAAGTAFSNAPIDHIGLIGRGVVTIFSGKGAANPTGTLTAQVVTSPDMTNWFVLTNFALITTPTAFPITNGFYGGTNLATTNNILLPGTVTTPVGSTAGWVTPYLAPLAFTNGGPVTITTPGVYQLAFNLDDQYRYIGIQFVPSATSGTNFVGSATLTAPNIY
jgi:hypothetical protein